MTYVFPKGIRFFMSGKRIQKMEIFVSKDAVALS